MCGCDDNKPNKEHLKIIFLDMDGVCNSGREDADYVSFVDGEYWLHEPDLVQKINRLTDKTGAKLVLSSTWRLMLEPEEIQPLFKKLGFTGEFIGRTEDLREYAKNYLCRGNEIEKFILDNEELLRYEHRYGYTSYIILDDDTDMLYTQRHNFIHINGLLGITDEQVEQGVTFLANPPIKDLEEYIENSV